MDAPLDGNKPEERPLIKKDAEVASLVLNGLHEVGSGEARKPGEEKISQVPYHHSAAALLVVVDNLWALEDWLVLTWILTIPLSFISVFFPTYWLQRDFRRDSRLTALWKALLFGVIAAVPTSVTGTPIGLALLAWAGINR